jgi:hypothetical protein
MEISESRVNNRYSLDSIEKWMGLEKGKLLRYYEELQEDDLLLASISSNIESHSQYKIDVPKLFKQTPITNVDWYGVQRIILYSIIREIRPETVVETGVYYGGNSVFILAALDKNNKGKLISIDYPQNIMGNSSLVLRHPWVGETEMYPRSYDPGFIIPSNLRDRFELIIGDSLQILPSLAHGIDLFVHDSEHTYSHVFSELECVWGKMSDSGMALIDDIDWSNGFFDFSLKNNLHPLLLTDNGKDNLRVRTGIVSKYHRYNDLKFVTKI